MQFSLQVASSETIGYALVQVMKLLIMQSPQHPVLKHPQSVFYVLVRETKFHTHTNKQVKL